MTWSRKYDFQAGKKISSSQVDEEFNQLIAAVNQVQADDNAKDADLRSKAQMKKITLDTGEVKINISSTSGDILASILSAGLGLHTFYAVAGSKNLPGNGNSIRGIANMTAPTYGWIYVTDANNKSYTNYLADGTWKGWEHLLSEKDFETNILWQSTGVYPLDVTYTPTKALKDCRNGWMFIWSDYDVGVGSNNIQLVTTTVHKAQLSIATSTSTLHIIPIDDVTNNVYVNKAIWVTNATFRGQEPNDDTANAKDVVLRMVVEF